MLWHRPARVQVKATPRAVRCAMGGSRGASSNGKEGLGMQVNGQGEDIEESDEEVDNVKASKKRKELEESKKKRQQPQARRARKAESRSWRRK